MTSDVWKQFEENRLTHSAAHYLMTIDTLLKDQGYARVTDIARRLNITRGSCSISLRPLKKRGLVAEDHNRFLQLSERGQTLAELVERNDKLLKILFRDVLGVDPEQAEIDACKVEHLLSLETSVKLAHFIHLIHIGEKGAVKKFLQELNQQPVGGSHDAEECQICRSITFFEDTADQEQPETASSNGNEERGPA